MTTSLLEAFNLSRSFGEFQALANTTLTLQTGEIVALTGPNGAGKTTLLPCLSGLLRPSTGEVHFGLSAPIRRQLHSAHWSCYRMSIRLPSGDAPQSLYLLRRRRLLDLPNPNRSARGSPDLADRRVARHRCSVRPARLDLRSGKHSCGRRPFLSALHLARSIGQRVSW